ncbi:12750_t:CDS:2 [Ambispora gerdemannii]|uniref:12750_t:CDS:1 n=1 Tax=Ambispora gerdemannii TaxID=144530 RepID=A0A9N9D474_9GLOM|nr:12750_t:CDS:2 [Ambispora gerdemannii]
MSSDVTSSSTGVMSNLPTVEHVKAWSRGDVKAFLQNNKTGLDLEDGDINKIYNQRIKERPIKKLRIEQGWKLYTTSDGHSVELPPQIIDMLASEKFVPDNRIDFQNAFQNLSARQSITLPHLGQEPKHFAKGYQGKALLVTGQMIDIWDKLSADSDHSIKRVLSGPMGVGKSYITYFLAAKAYAEGWLMLYIADAAELSLNTSEEAGMVICKYFLALNKDILTGAELELLVENENIDYSSSKVAGKILENLLKQVDRKTLLIIDEHGVLFEKDPVPERLHILKPLMNLTFWAEHYKGVRIILTGTAHAKYEMIYMKNGQSKWWMIYVAPLENNVFDMLLQMHPLLSKQGIKEEAIKVTNCMPRELMYLVDYVSELDPNTTDVNDFQEVLKNFENEWIDQLLIIVQSYYNSLQKSEKIRYYDSLTSMFLPSKPIVQFEWTFLDLGLIYRYMEHKEIHYFPLCPSAQKALLKINVVMLQFDDYAIIKPSGLSLGPGFDKVSVSDFVTHNSKPSTNIRQAFEVMSAQAGISQMQINGRNQIEMYLDEMYGPGHSAEIDSRNKFVVTQNGRHVPGFHIVYIRGSPGIPKHPRKVHEFPDVAHVTFEEITR